MKVTVRLTAKDGGHGTSKMSANMVLKAKYGLLRKIMERLTIKPQLGGAIGNVFTEIIEFHSQTGKEVQKGYEAKTPALVQ
jgi:hypothetical protein